MGRSRATAKKAGTAFESLIAKCLALHVDDRIERRARSGSSDRGDIGGVRAPWGPTVDGRMTPGRVVIECNPLDQYVTCTVRDLVGLLTGERP